MSLKIAIVGTGNVGFHLASQIESTEQLILSHIVSRQLEKAKMLIEAIGAASCIPLELKDLSSLNCDLIVLSIPDQKIEEVIQQNTLPSDITVVHTSGSQPINLLQQHISYGVLYPFQTFTKKQPVDFSRIPILIEGSDLPTQEVIKTVAESLSDHVKTVNSTDRLKVHLAAVFACNFSNYLYLLAEDILHKSGLELKDIEHLMQETVSKAVSISARSAQTGPAIRGDHAIIDKHLELLAENQETWKLYKLLSEQIASLSKE